MNDSPTPIDPASLRPHYSAFLRAGRALLTGHSHQAWPDVARAGLLAAFDDAALHVDDKWSRALDQAERVRRGVVARVGGETSQVALAASTHELVTRFLSALDLRTRPHLVTTSGEFHSLDRQLRRLAEAGVEVTFVDASPVDTLAARLAAALRPTTAALLASTVLFESSAIVPGLAEAVSAAARVGAEVLLDAYHAFGVVPFSLIDYGPAPFFLVAGGYKYAQWGEGACFLLAPRETTLRPVYTGWFADFVHLGDARSATVGYGATPAERFAGSTYDPSSHYRAAAVLEFFDRERLDVARLRQLSLRQTDLLIDGLDRQGAELVTPRAARDRGGFVAVRTPQAARIVERLREARVLVDSRGPLLRFGPAPYVTDAEIGRALELVGDLLRGA